MVALDGPTLGVHIAAGAVAILAGACALATEKGGRRHRLAGQAFVASMGVVVGTVFLLLAFEPTALRAFLALVGVFSGYFAFSGYRVLSRKRPRDGARRVDWVAAAAVVAVCVALGAWGVDFLLRENSLGVVMIVFAVVGVGTGLSDVRTFRGAGRRKPRTIDHLGRMVAAYIAAVTAVSVTNLTALPQAVRWLWPTVLGVLLIWYWERKYGDTGPFARIAPR